MRVFPSGASRAQLIVETPDGTKYNVNFDRLTSIDYSPGSVGCYGPDYTGASSDSLTLKGKATCELVALPANKEKPAPKPKKPTVRASAERVRKATVKHAQLTKRIHDTEQALALAKKNKEELDIELKTAREQLLAAAA